MDVRGETGTRSLGLTWDSPGDRANSQGGLRQEGSVPTGRMGCVLGLFPAQHPCVNKHQTLGGGQGICACNFCSFKLKNISKIF